ncbi:MAG: AAA family ATPase [Magnetococcales bacterium]|nr:AAA family ATPase [Magnetococcales bacterium]
MLKKLYVDNFRCLVNFTLELDRFALLMGENGSGKSAVMDALDKLRRFVVDQETVESIFQKQDCTFWEPSSTQYAEQIFELQVDGNGGAYLYRLVIEHSQPYRSFHMLEESLTFNGRQLFEFKAPKARLFRDDGSSGPEFNLEWSRSGVGWLMEGPDNRKLSWFREWLRSNLLLIRINPSSIASDYQPGSAVWNQLVNPGLDLERFALWYQHVIQADLAVDLTLTLRRLFPGFLGMQTAKMGGELYQLQSVFSVDGKGRGGIPIHGLSHGQKCLLVLYALLAVLKETEGVTLFIDEPENYLALREVQPWLDRIDELMNTPEPKGQCILISHHPRIINFLAEERGIWFYREGGSGHTRLKRIAREAEGDELPIATLVEWGWIIDD